jgi:hypothetical protein
MDYNFAIDINNKAKKIVQEFNNQMKNWRLPYSLFLTNFRDNGRKRISFDVAFRVISIGDKG